MTSGWTFNPTNVPLMPGNSNEETASVRTWQRTISDLPFKYFHLVLVVSNTSTPVSASLDILTARTYLTSALQQYLGLSGTAIPVDILKMAGNEVWIRVPRETGNGVQGALSQWLGKDGNVSWRVKGQSDFVGILAVGRGQDLFGGE